MANAKTAQLTQQTLQKKALEQLAIIGGALTNDEDIEFSGKKFIFPEQFRGDLPGLATFVARYVQGQEEQIVVEKVFNYRPMDGAMAVYECLKNFFGYAQSKARQGMFGPEPPREVTVATGFVNGVLQHQTVPWGDMVLPGLKNATLTITQTIDRKRGQLLYLTAVCRRADKAVIDGFYKTVEKRLEEHSIYRGHAINGAMEFFDTDLINPDLFVYSAQVWADAQTNILSPMTDVAVLQREGMSQKRVVLLEGPYGTGKSGLGRTASKVAVANGWTAITARPGVDDPFMVLQTARLYQPAMVFIEDVDTFAASQDPNYVTRLLDEFDGFDKKDLQMLLVLTTNHVDKIHKGMMRPGRLDAVIHIGGMDQEGVEKLAKIRIGDRLDAEIDWAKVFEATEGFMPAFVAEAIERSVRYSIARTGEVGKINTDDLVFACGSLRPQLALQENATDSTAKLPPLDAQFRQMLADEVVPPSEEIREMVQSAVNELVNGAAIHKPNGDKVGNIFTNG